MLTTSMRRRGLSLRISFTDRCQLRCLYCRPSEGVPLAPRREVLRREEIIRFVRAVGSRWPLTKVHVTGGEPLMRRGILDLVAGLASVGAADLALTTNGQRLAPMARDLRQAGLRRVNVSLDTLDDATYAALTCGGRLAPTLEGIDTARRSGLAPLRLNTVVLRGVNDHEVVDLARFGLERGCEVRFLELMPIGVAAARHEAWFVAAAEVRDRLARAFELEPLPAAPGASSRTFRARDSRGRTGTVGFISPCTDPFCRGCRRLRLTATGRLLGCLAQADGIDLRPLLQQPGPLDEAALARAVERALRLKRAAGRFVGPQLMVAIGG